jgi:hypothetical protein
MGSRTVRGLTPAAPVAGLTAGVPYARPFADRPYRCTLASLSGGGVLRSTITVKFSIWNRS